MSSFEMCVLGGTLLSALTSAFKCKSQYDPIQNKCGRKNVFLSSLKDFCFYTAFLYLAIKIMKISVL